MSAFITLTRGRPQASHLMVLQKLKPPWTGSSPSTEHLMRKLSPPPRCKKSTRRTPDSGASQAPAAAAAATAAVAAAPAEGAAVHAAASWALHARAAPGRRSSRPAPRRISRPLRQRWRATSRCRFRWAPAAAGALPPAWPGPPAGRATAACGLPGDDPCEDGARIHCRHRRHATCMSCADVRDMQGSLQCACPRAGSLEQCVCAPGCTKTQGGGVHCSAPSAFIRRSLRGSRALIVSALSRACRLKSDSFTPAPAARASGVKAPAVR